MTCMVGNFLIIIIIIYDQKTKQSGQCVINKVYTLAICNIILLVIYGRTQKKPHKKSIKEVEK